jgi:WD40 repeat protein
MTISPTPKWTAVPTAGLQINSVAISPDGALSLCGTSNEFSTGQFGMYCYYSDGTLAWQRAVTGTDATQGVFWVALSRDKRFAAAGGETAKDIGFLTICDAANGNVLLNVQNGLPGRVNQVSFSNDGTLLLAAFSNALQLYKLQPAGTFALHSTATIATALDCISAVIAGDGSRVWAAAINYGTTPYSGQVECLEIRGGLFSIVNTYPLAAGAMRIATTSDGLHAAAALHTGGCALFKASQTGTPAWTYTPTEPTLSLAYAIDVTQTDAGDIVVACGTNTTGDGGFLYVVDADPLPQLRWISSLQYSANPGVCLDRNADLVTATDGKPKGSGVAATPESPGNFYLFDGQSGAQLWQYPTALMNWPMVITPDGTAALGGSDDGTLCYW